MARRDLSNRDYSQHAGGELDSVLRRQVAEDTPKIKTVTAEQAMTEERVVEHASTRDVTRVLFISRNVELLNPTKQTLDGYLNISEVFDEVHVLILRQGIEPRQPVIRPDENVFMYTVATRFWWQMPIAGIDMIKSQLVFADGFRPDLIVARDPFESSLVALWASRKFNCPAQLHVLINYFHPSYLELASPNRWRRFIARYTVPKFLSVRAGTERILTRLRAKTDVVDLARLPQLNPYEALAKQQQTLDLKEKYPQYIFTILFVDRLDDSTAALAAIDAARYMLRNPRIAMIIMGDGPGRAACDEESEELMLQAAGAKAPMVMTRTELRDDLFTHMESAYLCDADNPQSLSDGVHELMENYELRQQIREQAFVVVSQELHQDPEEYRRQYRASIEAALFAEERTEPVENTETDAAEVEVEQ